MNFALKLACPCPWCPDNINWHEHAYALHTSTVMPYGRTRARGRALEHAYVQAWMWHTCTDRPHACECLHLRCSGASLVHVHVNVSSVRVKGVFNSRESSGHQMRPSDPPCAWSKKRQIPSDRKNVFDRSSDSSCLLSLSESEAERDDDESSCALTASHSTQSCCLLACLLARPRSHLQARTPHVHARVAGSPFVLLICGRI